MRGHRLTEPSERTFVYEYNLKDHLGNNRVSFIGSDLGGAIDVTQSSGYYPFGMVMFQNNNVATTGFAKNKYLYNGKELQDDAFGGAKLNWYDYGARFYDPQIGRWSVIDILTEKKQHISPYVYCSGNPINRIDADGRDDYRLDRDGNIAFIQQTDDQNNKIYATTSKGEIDNKNFIQVSKNVLNSKTTTTIKSEDSNGNIESSKTDIYMAFSDKEATKFFEFASKNSDVEWNQVKTSVEGIKGDEEVNYIGTSHTEGSDASQDYITSKVMSSGVNIREANHDHPNNTETVSQGDVNVATKIQSKFSKATFNILTPGNSKYTPYNMYSIPGLLIETVVESKKKINP